MRGSKIPSTPTGDRASQSSGKHLSTNGRTLLVAAMLAVAVLGLGATCVSERPSADLPTERLEEAVRERALALAEMENGRYENAAAHLEKLTRILPDNILPPVNLAICYSRLNRPEEALQQVERARALDPDNPSMLYTLARLLEEDEGRNEEWLAVIRHFAAVHPEDVRPYYLEAQALAEERSFDRAIPLLERGLRSEPENLVLLTELLVAAAAASDFETLTDALNALEDRLDGFTESADKFASQLRESARDRKEPELLPKALVMRNLLRPGELYQVHLAPLIGGRQAGGGLFPQLDFDPPLPKSVQGGQDIAIGFSDATSELSGDVRSAVLRAVVRREPDRDAILATTGNRLVRWHDENPALVHELDTLRDDIVLLQAFDGDEIADLMIVRSDVGVTLHRGLDEEAFGPGVLLAEFPGETAADRGARVRGALSLDIDHDGDLDVFIAREAARDLYFQNNGDGSWTEKAQELGLAGEAIDTSQAVAADFDDDGDLDLVTAHPGSHLRLYLNPRAGVFTDASLLWGLNAHDFREIRVGDLNNDGLFDLAGWGATNAELLLNSGQGFEPMALPTELVRSWAAGALSDFDNDGDLDVIVAAHSSDQALMIRNRRAAGVSIETTAISAAKATRLVTGDFDNDGDLDVLSTHETEANRLWRNEGGNRNRWLRLVLRGRHDNNSKNNVEGLHCRIESRAGGAFQTVLGNGRVNHLGLGAQRQVEVLRVIWTNGIAQLWQLVTSDRTLVEEQMLKGSCPFLYTWNGESFDFHTDLMWKSPLGMTLADGRSAPHQSARDFVLIPEEALQPAGDDLWLQVTEELWETIYVDKQRLYAVDHPEEVELVIDESFRPPPYPSQIPMHWVENQLPPYAATDNAGRDVLDQISTRDARHVDQLPLTRYQGLTEGHSLSLSFRGIPELGNGESLKLLLWGWTFPTDTSINFALAQDSSRSPTGPSLELLQPDGSWALVEPFIGFPNGKRKAMVVDLGRRLPAHEATLRIRTSMQIYWDAATLSVDEPEPVSRITTLTPAAADLHYRGYSRLYRETPTGPHLFDYSEVSIGPRFRDMAGAFTRYGEVAQLLEDEDDRYVVMNAGDEMTIRYDARRLPPLPSGWRRDWVLYTDGWVKDADIHTANSQTVEPLPYHGQKGYPAQPEHAYPDDAEHRLYLDSYQTREIDDTPFRKALQERP